MLEENWQGLRQGGEIGSVGLGIKREGMPVVDFVVLAEERD